MAIERKWVRVLRALIDRPALHRLEAERDPAIRDHVLPSTVTDIQRKGVRVDREIIGLPGYGGSVVHVALYRLDEENRERARRLLGNTSGDVRVPPCGGRSLSAP